MPLCLLWHTARHSSHSLGLKQRSAQLPRSPCICTQVDAECRQKRLSSSPPPLLSVQRVLVCQQLPSNLLAVITTCASHPPQPQFCGSHLVWEGDESLAVHAAWTSNREARCCSISYQLLKPSSPCVSSRTVNCSAACEYPRTQA